MAIPRLLGVEHRPGEALPGPAKYTWQRVGFRPPRKGEHYVSGAVPFAYLAPNDLTTPYLVVAKGERYVARTAWARD